MEVLQHPTLRRLGRRLGFRLVLTAAVRKFGYDLVKRHYYSSVPDLEQLPEEIWDARSVLSGLTFDIAAGLRFVERELAPHIAEYAPPATPTGDPRDVYLENSFYEGLDAETLYAMVRRFKPGRIIELGSGMSTLMIADARARNEANDRGLHIVYDPHPRSDLVPALQQVASLRRSSATAIPLTQFAELRDGDFLFVDTTHTVKIGSDVNRVILDVLPLLAPGVIVHFHDIFLPWEYPREFFTYGFSWAEQYLLQAFLAFNDQYEVLFGNHSLKREFPDAVRKLVPSAARSPRAAAFWMRRREAARPGRDHPT